MLPQVDTNLGGYSYSSYRSQTDRVESSTLATAQPEKVSAIDEVEKTDAPNRAENFDIDAIVKQIWSFTSGRIAQAEADGASPKRLESLWQAAEDGLKQGFNEAKDILEDMGELDEALAMKIDTAFGQVMDMLSERDSSVKLGESLNVPAANEPTASVVSGTSSVNATNRAISLYQYQRQTFSLDLTTAQGDKIQIRSVVEQEANADDLRFGALSSTQWGSRQDSGFSLIIKGDLNDQERADLDALLAEVNEMADEFYNGDYGTAFNMAKDLNIDGTSLRSMDLSLQEVEQKGAAVYSEFGDKPAKLPKGLAPLQEYANRLIDAQSKWQKAFNAPDGLLQAMQNHPLNKGDLQHMARMMMV